MDLPIIGIGTYKIRNQDEINFVLQKALYNGYEMIDTAEIYRNHKYIGNFLQDKDRSKIWITTKVNFVNVKKGDIKVIIESIDKTLEDLRTNYIDLYLIHCPVENMNEKIWNILRAYQKEGKIRYVGVSNFTVEKLKDFMEKIGEEESKYIFCNQIEYNPFLNRKELIDLCFKHNIKVIAYGSLYKKNELIKNIANKCNKSEEQILLKWAIQNNIHIIPMAKEEQYIKDNINLNFIIDNKDLQLMNELNENYSMYTKYL
jgi:diketogulonate reductase-like aldo/keto reductase